MSISVETGTPESFDELIAAQNVLVVVYFWGPDCPNCEVFARDLPGLLEAISGVEARLVKIDAYEFPELARRFALFGIPGFVLFKNGQKLGMMRQYYGREYWTAVITEHAAGVGARLSA